jgi:hypothetical protein
VLRRRLALCDDVRIVTVRHERAQRPRPAVTIRAARRPARSASAPVPAWQRAAA